MDSTVSLLLQTGFGESSVKHRGVTNLTGLRFRAKGAPMTAGHRATTVARRLLQHLRWISLNPQLGDFGSNYFIFGSTQFDLVWESRSGAHLWFCFLTDDSLGSVA